MHCIVLLYTHSLLMRNRKAAVRIADAYHVSSTRDFVGKDMVQVECTALAYRGTFWYVGHMVGMWFYCIIKNVSIQHLAPLAVTAFHAPCKLLATKLCCEHHQ
jgi:hypothetical protein